MLFVAQQDKSKFNNAIQPYEYTVKNASRRKTVLIVRAQTNERDSVKKDIEERLSNANIDYELSISGGSVGSTIVSFGQHKIQITYKPISGGQSEATLNSTITELVPCLAFMSKKRFANIDDLYDFVSQTSGNEYGVYVNGKDAETGKQYIERMPTSSKYKEKMENALAILDYLNDLNRDTPIQQVFWGYRAKPAGVSASHKGDLFIKFKNGNMLGIAMLGVSIKVGAENTHEPQLNTFVNKFFDSFGYKTEKDQLKLNVFRKVHSNLALPNDWDSRPKKKSSLNVITEFKKNNPREYEKFYDDMLEMVRDSLVKAAGKNKDRTLDYIKRHVLKKDDKVPLVVVKAIGTTYKMITDEDDLGAFLPRVENVRAYTAATKQDWFIELSASPRKKLTMNMSVRSNKPQPENKIAQGFNLAVKYNGIK